MKEIIEKLYSIGPRRPGSPNERIVCDYLSQQFESFGLEVKTEDVPLSYWNPTDWSLSRSNGENFPAFYIPYTSFEEVTGELVYLNPRHKIHYTKDLKGKIVVTDIEFPMLNGAALKSISLGIYDPDDEIPDGDIHPATWIRQNWELYDYAVKNGAIGFIGILKDQPGGSDRYYAPYGFREGDQILNKPIPGMWVSKYKRKELLALCQKKESFKIKIEGDCTETAGINLIALKRGETDQNIIIGCHHDTPFQNAVEDSSGLSVLLNLARSLAPQKTQKNIIFLVTSGHFYGSIGTRTFIKKNKALLKMTTAALHIEHIALEAKEEDGKNVLTGQTETCAIFVPYNKKCVSMTSALLKKFNLNKTMILGAHGPLGNFPPTDGGDFYLENIPIFNYICNPIYLLVDEDTLDKVDYDRLARVHAFFMQLTTDLDMQKRNDLIKRDFASVRLKANLFTIIKKTEKFFKTLRI